MKNNVKQTIFFKHKPKIISNYSIVGKKEGEGPLKDYFDHIMKNDLFGEKTFEKAERKMLETAIYGAIKKAKLTSNDINCLLSGDLLNQIISASFTARDIEIPFLGLYSACSTMSESLLVGGILVDGGYLNTVACATTSHFSTAEKQYRYPLELGNQRPPVSQWTVTGSGCCIISKKGSDISLSNATIGVVTDYGIKDANNMGAAMAVAAKSTLVAHFIETNTTPDDYDLIVTGDLGKLGSDILNDLMEKDGYTLGKTYHDCGQLIFSKHQRVYQGGSGAGCSASVLNGYIIPKMQRGEFKRVLFCATGALLSTLSTQQGESIPCICHAIEIIKEDNICG